MDHPIDVIGQAMPFAIIGATALHKSFTINSMHGEGIELRWVTLIRYPDLLGASVSTFLLSESFCKRTLAPCACSLGGSALIKLP
jgi:hypothetical protein